MRARVCVCYVYYVQLQHTWYGGGVVAWNTHTVQLRVLRVLRVLRAAVADCAEPVCARGPSGRLVIGCH